MLAFLSLHLESLGMSADGAGALMGVTMAGVILFQVPVAWLGDRLGRLPMLLGCYVVVAAGLALMPGWSPSIWLAVWLFLLGACSGALYPLALALLGDRLPQAGLARAYALFMAMECVGSQMGAAAMGQARDWWGDTSMFGVGLAALALVLAIWGVSLVWQRCRQTPAKVTEEELRTA
jgi:MFS family permease